METHLADIPVRFKPASYFVFQIDQLPQSLFVEVCSRKRRPSLLRRLRSRLFCISSAARKSMFLESSGKVSDDDLHVLDKEGIVARNGESAVWCCLVLSGAACSL